MNYCCKKIISTMLAVIMLALWMPWEPISKIIEVNAANAVEEWEYNYTGAEQTFTTPYKGKYKIELYGAQGASSGTNAIGGKGAYIAGEVILEKNQTISINIGSQQGYNGGGEAGGNYLTGGGATDIRIGGNSIEDRALIAAGGGGGYAQINYHTHTNDCYKEGSHTSSCASHIEYHPYDCGSVHDWDGDGHGCDGFVVYDCGGHRYLACSKTIDSYKYENGKETSSSNNTLYQGSQGGGGGYYGGNSSYAGTSYASTQYFSAASIVEGNKEGNGYAKITLLSSPPEVTLTASTTADTNQDVILTANATDNIGFPEKPYSWNGEQRTNLNRYAVTKNGTYTVDVINVSELTTQKTYTVTNIDKLPPVVNSTSQRLNTDKKSTNVTIKGMDYSSNDYKATGIVGYAITENEVQPNTFGSSNIIKVGENGTYYAWAKDAVGNISKAKTVLVPNIEIEIRGNIKWNDQENKYSSRMPSQIKLYRKSEENGEEILLETQRLEAGQASYSFQTRQCDDAGKDYIFRIEQETIDGYETLYTANNITSNGKTEDITIDITNNLILPEYESQIITEPVNSFENKLLKNADIKIITNIVAKSTNKQNVGLGNDAVNVQIDEGITINKNSIKITYLAKDGSQKNITKYTINNNVITTSFEENKLSNTTAGDSLQVELTGNINNIKTLSNSVTYSGYLREYKTGKTTNVNLGNVTKAQKQDLVENQLPEANIKIQKTDSITEEKLTDAIFALYEWNGSKYEKVETITDQDKDGIYESKTYRWNNQTQGKYKIVEEGIPEYHENLNFSMEYQLKELHAENYTITADYNNQNYTITYGKRNPDDFDKTNGIVENEPWKIKAQIEKIDAQTQNTIQSQAEFTVYEWNNVENKYEEYKSYKTGEKVNIVRKQDNTYITEDWLYYTPKNEGKYRIIETKAPYGYYANIQNNEKQVYDISILEAIKTSNYEGQKVQNEATIKITNNKRGQVTNNRVDATLNVTIVDKETKGAAQADASLKNAKYGIYALEDIKHSDGVTTRYSETPGVLYKKDELIETKTTDELGKMSFENLECGIYYIKMLEAPEGYVLDETKYKIDFSYVDENKAHLEITGVVGINVKKQAFQIYKLKENEQLLSGAGFTIYRIKDLSIITKQKITRVTKDTYTLNDEQAKNSAQLQGKQNEDGTYYLTDLIDYYYKIDYTEEKQNTLPGNEKVYHPYNMENEKLVKDYSETAEGIEIQEIETDNKGYLKSPKLAYGEYIVLETSVPRKQQVANNFVVKIEENSEESQELRYVIDKDFKTRVKIYIKDSNTKNTILNKTTYFAIKNEETGNYITKMQWNGSKFEEFGTPENPFATKKYGYIITPVDLPIGKYVLEEINAPQGYVVVGKEGYSNEKQTTWEPKEKVRFEVKSNTIYYMDHYLGRYIIVVNQENEEAKGTIIIKSQGEYLASAKTENETYQFEYEARKIENAEYEIYAKEDIYSQDNNGSKIYSKDEKITKATTNSEGEAIIQNLPQGKYYIKETMPGYGFSLNQETKEVEISYEGQEIPVIFKNALMEETRQTVEITLQNTDKETKEKISGGTYGIYTKEEIQYIATNGESKTIGSNTLLAKAEGNENGEIKFSKAANIDLPIGVYYIKEITAPEGYIKTKDELQILAMPKGTEEKITINMAQEKEKTKLKIKNIGQDTEELIGAKIEIQDENQNTIIKLDSLENVNKVEGLITNKKYTLKSVNPASGYVTNKDISFMLDESGKLQIDEEYLTPELENTIVIVSLKTKLNVIFRENEENIKGISFSIKDKEEKSVVASTEEKENTIKIRESEKGYYAEKIPIGEYVLQQEEIPYGEGYVEKQKVNIEVKNENTEQIIDIKQEVSKLLISIIDEETKEKIEDANIQIQKEDKIIASTQDKKDTLKIEKNENGYYLEKLPVGKYKILEINHNGYKTIKEQEIEIKDTKELQKVELKTRKLIFEVEVQKQLKNIIVNGNTTKVEKDDIMKVEVKERKIPTENLELEYTIKIINKGETSATINTIEEKIPEGFEIVKNENWKVNGKVATNAEKIELKAGESKEITITGRWKNAQTNFGEKTATVELKNVTNPFNYEEKDKTNNKASVLTVVSVGTGLEEQITIIRIIIIIFTACMTICLMGGIEILILKKK